MSIMSMTTTPITLDVGMTFNDMDLSFHNGQGQGLCDGSKSVITVPVPIPSQGQGQMQLRSMRLASGYDFGTGTEMDMDTGLDIDMTFYDSLDLRNEQDQLVINLRPDTEPQQNDMFPSLNLVEITETTEGLAVVSPA
jgi:hypothetical protein